MCAHTRVLARASVCARARACVRICTRAKAYSADPCVAAVTFVAADMAEMQLRRRSRLHAREPSEKYRMRAQIARCCDRSRFDNDSKANKATKKGNQNSGSLRFDFGG